MTANSKGTLTHSSMTCAKTCLRMYQFRYVHGVVRQAVDSPLRIGSLVHLGLEIGKKPEEAEVPDWCDDEDAIYKMHCDYEMACGMLQAYFEYWGDGNVEVIENEKEFKVPIMNPETSGLARNFGASGKIDKIVKTPDGRICIMEHKTTSEDLDPEGTYWRRLRMDQQISHYILGARMAGIQVESSVLYDVIRRPQYKPKNIPVLDEKGEKIVRYDETGERVFKKNGDPRKSAGEGMSLEVRSETPTEFGFRVYTEMNADPEKYFCRREIPRLDADLTEYQFELWQQQKLLAECINNGYFYRNTSACIRYQKPCQYFDLCTQGIEVEDNIAPLGFEFERPHSELSDTEGGEL